jgi:hypothetical protein
VKELIHEEVDSTISFTMSEDPENQTDQTPDEAESSDWAPKEMDDDKTRDSSSDDTFVKLAAEEPALPEPDFSGETGTMPAITEEGEDPTLAYSGETEPTKEVVPDSEGAQRYAESLKRTPPPKREHPEVATEPDHSYNNKTLPISVGGIDSPSDETRATNSLPQRPPQNVMQMVMNKMRAALSNEETKPE